MFDMENVFVFGDARAQLVMLVHTAQREIIYLYPLQFNNFKAHREPKNKQCD